MTPGKATTTLPRHVTEASRGRVLLGPYTQDSKERRDMLRILLAEDDPLIVEGLSELLANDRRRGAGLRAGRRHRARAR